MTGLKLIGASLLLGVSPAALAQQNTGVETKPGLGVQVSPIARAKRGGEPRGVGPQVRVLAHRQAEVNRERGQDEHGDIADSYAASSPKTDAQRGIGPQVRELARGRKDAEAKGLGKQVRALAHAASRAEAKEARLQAGAARTEALASRQNARAAREQARAARETAKGSRPGRGN